MDSALIQWLANYGVSGLVIVLLLTKQLVPGWVHKQLENAYEKRGDALAIERQRNADLMQIASVGTKAMSALAEVAEERRSQSGDPPVPPGKVPP